MAWSDQQYSVPQGPPQGQAQGPLQPGPLGVPAGQPSAGGGYYGVNPLQQAAAPSQMLDAGAYNPPPMPPNPMMQAQPVPGPVPLAGQQPARPINQQQMPAAPGQQAPGRALDDDKIDTTDVEWVNRTKRAIAASRGDPHRQVQLIQHMRSQYLKQRFGRTVHTDEA
jgi:hypothetical protein